jgi:hypothetical protein
MARNKVKLVSLTAIAGLFVASRLPMQAQTKPTPTGGAGTRSVLVLLCQYPDVPNTYGFTAAGILNTWMTNTGTVNGQTVDDSINGLVQDTSGGTISLQGTQAYGWYTLPKPLSYYSQFPWTGNSPDGGNMAGNDCIAAAQNAGVNLAPFTYAAV